MYQWWSEPIFRGVFLRLLMEPLIGVRAPEVEDESVGDFLTRRFGKNLTDKIASAFFHGIYAGDLYKLSARTLMPLLWYAETRGGASGILSELTSLRMSNRGLIPEKAIQFAQLRIHDPVPPSAELDTMMAMLQGASVYTFKRGLGQIISALETSLSGNPKVAILKSSPVEHVTLQKGAKEVLVRSRDVTSKFDYVVSSLAPNMMESFLAATAQNQGKQLDDQVTAACRHSGVSVSVMVVNLYYRNPDLIPPTTRGFGYLIPRSVPLDENPERALGVLFSSETSGRPGTLVPQGMSATRPMDEEEPRKGFAQELESDQGQDTAPGTKLTVMLGGRWWDGWEASDLPSEEQGIEKQKGPIHNQ
jgi:oxygen-dependent protoporphyrinogen oxidase